MRLALLLAAALASGCASSPCESANADQDDPTLRTCAFSASLAPDGPTAFTPADGAPVALTVPAFAPDPEPTTLPDGTRLVASYFGLSWSGTGGDLSPADSASGVASVAVAPQAYALGMATGGRVRIVAASGAPVAEVQVPDGADALLGRPNRATRLAFSPDGAALVASDALHNITAWDAATGEVRWRASLADGLAPGDGVRALTVSPDGRHVATATRYAVDVWDAASGASVARWAHPGKTTVTGVFFAPEGGYVAVRKAGRYTASNTRVTTRDHHDREQGFARTVDDGPSQRDPTVLVWQLP